MNGIPDAEYPSAGKQLSMAARNATEAVREFGAALEEAQRGSVAFVAQEIANGRDPNACD